MKEKKKSVNSPIARVKAMATAGSVYLLSIAAINKSGRKRCKSWEKKNTTNDNHNNYNYNDNDDENSETALKLARTSAISWVHVLSKCVEVVAYGK